MQGMIEVPRIKKKYRRKEEMLDRVSGLTTPDFIERVVYPIACKEAEGVVLPHECETAVLSNRGRGRAVVRYQFNDDVAVIGKLYSDALGPHSFEVMSALWKDNFGNEGSYRVPQPLAYLTDHKLMLMAEVKGNSLKTLIEGDEELDADTLADYMRQAARWLVELHSAPCRIGRPETLCGSANLFKVMRSLTKAAAVTPQHERERLIDAVKTLCRLGEQCEDRVPMAQTHGRYHVEEIFVNGGTVTSVDFDGSVPSDPAKDIAKFLTVAGRRAFKRTENAEIANNITQAFLDEYLSLRPESAVNLQFYWGTALLQRLLEDLASYDVYESGRKKDEFESYASKIRFQADELDAALAEDWTR